MSKNISQFSAKKALCLLFSFIFAVFSLFTLKTNISASEEGIHVTAKADKSSYSWNETVTVYVTVSNNAFFTEYNQIKIAPSSSQYYLNSSNKIESIDSLKFGQENTVSFSFKLSEKDPDLNIFQKIVLFFKYLFSGKSPLDGQFDGSNKITTSLEIIQYGIKKIDFNVYYNENIKDISIISTTRPLSTRESTTSRSDISTTSTTSTTAATATQPARTYRFRNSELLAQHYEKHGIEMGFSSAEDYEKAASAVADNPSALHKTEAEDGDDIYYIVSTNEFVVISTDGFIRTYFKPDTGKAYFDKQ